MKRRRPIPLLVGGLLLLLFGGASADSTSTTAGGGPEAPEDYALHCSACHTLEGGGVPGLVPSLRELSPLFRHPEGRSYLARVPGVAQAPLSDARLARLLNWVLDEFSGIRPIPPFTADEVGGARDSPLRDPVAARAELFRGADEEEMAAENPRPTEVEQERAKRVESPRNPLARATP